MPLVLIIIVASANFLYVVTNNETYCARCSDSLDVMQYLLHFQLHIQAVYLCQILLNWTRMEIQLR